MTSAQIREADRSGMEIGSHTVTHANLANLSAAAVRLQIVQSKDFLEQVVGHQVTSFCYPSGKYTSAVASAVAAEGFQDATTTSLSYSYTTPNRAVWRP